MEPASVQYKYRLFTLGSIRLVARCEVHCWVSKRGEQPPTYCCLLSLFGWLAGWLVGYSSFVPSVLLMCNFLC
jgi:hypothetical protein